jgi:hypothetical protein
MSSRTDELLYDSQATLRLVDHELNELRDPAGSMREPAAAPCRCGAGRPSAAAAAAEIMAGGALVSLPSVLERASQEITAVLASLRESRNAMAQASVERLQHTHQKLREVSSATEVAATDILDSLDRAGQIVDDLDAEEADAASDAPKRGPELRAKLREEIFGMMGALQFQDITTQQLAYASSVLIEMETRIAEVARLFAPGSAIALAVPAAAAPEALAPSTFDPNATTLDAETRQALADAIFTAR